MTTTLPQLRESHNRLLIAPHIAFEAMASEDNPRLQDAIDAADTALYKATLI